MDTKREILERVAAGDLTPEEAAERLAAVDAPEEAPPLPPPPTGTVKRVRLETALGTATVIGDPDVADVVADGDHTATREGDTVTITVTDLPGEGHDHGRFHFMSGKGRLQFNSGRGIVFGPGSKPSKVTVRMNPLLALDAEVGAGKLIVREVRGPITAEVAMGSLRVDGARAPFDVEVAMGSAHISGRLDHGAAKVRCDMGSATIDLEKGSSVKVRARTSMGKVALPGVAQAAGIGIGQGTSESVVGGGDATLDIECAMGSVRVSSPGGSMTMRHTP